MGRWAQALRGTDSRETYLGTDVSLDQDLLVSLRRLADRRSGAELVREKLGGLLQVDAEVMQAVDGRDKLLLVALYPLDDDLRGLRARVSISSVAERANNSGRTAILAASFSAFCSSFFSFFAKSFSSASRCSTVKLASLSSRAPAEKEAGQR